MEFKSLFFLVSTVTIVVSASTLPDVLAQLSSLGTSITEFADVAATNGTQQATATAIDKVAGDIHQNVNSTITVITSLEKPIPDNACPAIMSAFDPMVAPTSAGIQALIAQHDALSSIRDVIHDDLIAFRGSAIKLGDAVHDVLPHCDDNSTLVAVTSIFDKGIEAYST